MNPYRPTSLVSPDKSSRWRSSAILLAIFAGYLSLGVSTDNPAWRGCLIGAVGAGVLAVATGIVAWLRR